MLRLGPLGADAARLARAMAVMEQAELDQAARLADLELPAAARAADLLVQVGVLDDIPLVGLGNAIRGVRRTVRQRRSTGG
jgi:hypothetical protein